MRPLVEALAFTTVGFLVGWLFYCLVTLPGAARFGEPALLARQITAMERGEERRHAEVLIRIESLRRQMLAVHGKKYLDP